MAAHMICGKGVSCLKSQCKETCRGNTHSYDALRDRTGLSSVPAVWEKTKMPVGSGMDW